MKYLLVNFMQPKPGMGSDYVRNEREDFKPVHQAMVNDGNMVSWSLYSLVHPSGTVNNHQYVTVDAFSSYDQIGADNEAAWKKVSPGKNAQSAYDNMARARDHFRTELWELMLSTN